MLPHSGCKSSASTPTIGNVASALHTSFGAPVVAVAPSQLQRSGGVESWVPFVHYYEAALNEKVRLVLAVGMPLRSVLRTDVAATCCCLQGVLVPAGVSETGKPVALLSFLHLSIV